MGCFPVQGEIMASVYYPFAQWSSSSNQFYLTGLPTTSNLPISNAPWAITTDSNGDWYLMPFNYSGFQCSNINSISGLSNYSNFQPEFFDSSIDFSSGDTFYYKLTPLFTSYSSSNARWTTDFRKPIVDSVANVQSLCSGVYTYSNNTATSRFIINYVELPDDSGSGSGGSTDITPLIPAILMIPATLLVISFFKIIFNMFMNKKVRG